MHEIEIEFPPETIPEYDYNTWKPDEYVVDNCKLLFRQFFYDFMHKNVPCVIKNIACDWESTKYWVEKNQINYNYIIEMYGDLVAPIADCTNIQFNAHCKTDMNVLEYIEYLMSNNENRILYLKDWHLKNARPNDNFYDVPSYFAMDWLNEYAIDKNEDDFMFVYIGPKGSWTPLHEDVYCSYSWSVNIVGKKKWILFPPGEENKLKDKLGNLPLVFNAEKYNDIKYYEIMQESGDAIFVPSGWHHQVFNELNTISINHNWINACNIHFVWKALQKSLIMVEHQIKEFKDTPEFPMDCQIMLKSFFGMDFEVFITFLCYIAKKRLQQLQGVSRIYWDKYYIGNNIIKFDLRRILNVMYSINAHSVFLNKYIPDSLEKDFIEIKNNIEHIVKCSN